MRTLVKMAVVAAAVVAVYGMATQAPAGTVVYWNVGGPRVMVAVPQVVVAAPVPQVVAVPQTVVAAPAYYPAYGYYPYTSAYAYYPPAYYPPAYYAPAYYPPAYYAPPISFGFGFSFGGHRHW